jgi:hypothetical protein
LNRADRRAASRARSLTLSLPAVLVRASVPLLIAAALGVLLPWAAGAQAVDAAASQPEAPEASRGGEVTAAHASLPAVPHSDVTATIDGFLDDPVWKNALVIELDTETQPGENVQPPVETHAYLVEDGARLLLAFDARDPEPKSIRAYLRDRDSAFNDDFVGIVLDTFGDQRRGYEFFVNALGVQMDLTQDDVNQREDDSWDAIWASAGRITEQGFTVEVAIPFSQLRFTRTDGEREWGIDVLRFRPRTNRTRISNNALERGRNCYVCQFERVRGMAGIEAGKNLEIVPSLTASSVERRATSPAVGDWEKGSADAEVGLNVRWAVTQDLTANLALNPDFSQVEADVAQLEVNSQFALFYPESRPFFLEGADYFSTQLQAVFTRTVADPDYGAKLTGQVDDNTFGVFLAEDAVTNILLPGPLANSSQSLDQANTALVGRYSRNVGTGSTIGALLTARHGDGYHNDVAGFDGRIRLNDRHTVRFQYLASDTQYPTDTATTFALPSEPFDGDALGLRYTFSSRNWYADLEHKDFDSSFRADAGFVPRVDIKQQELELNRIWQRTEPGQKWNQIRVGVNATNTDDQSGSLLGRTVEPFVSFSGPLQSYIQFGAGPSKTFWKSDVFPEGTLFSGSRVFAFTQFRPRGGVNVTLQISDGDQVDFANSRLGKEFRVRPSVDWNVNQHLLLRLQHTMSRLEDQDGDKIFKADLTDLRVTWQFNVRSFVRFTTQRQLVSRNVDLFVARATTLAESLNVGTQMLYSYKLNPQTVVYAGYSDNALDDDSLLQLTRTDRTLFAKVSYAWLR